MGWQLWVLAWRNLARQRWRTAAALAAIVFGVTSLLLASGFMEWIFWAMRESTIQSRLGHVQVIRPGYLTVGVADPYSYLLPADAPQRAVLEAMPGVRIVAPRLNFSGLISHGDITLSFIGEGVDPAKEVEASKYVVMTQGKALLPDDGKGVILGKGLAVNLGVGLGDTVVLLGHTASGGVNALEATVRGMFYTSTKAYDDVGLRLPLSLAQQLLHVNGAHEWVVVLDRTEYTDVFLKRLRARFTAAHVRLEFVPWYRRADFYRKTVTLFTQQMRVVWVIIAALIVLTISNTLTMTVLERTGEIGTLMALGDRRRKILGLFLAEGGLLGLAGGVLGAGLGTALALVISAIGIPMPPPPGMDEAFTGQIRLNSTLVTGAVLMGLVTAVLASLYPAWKASRLIITVALRYNR